MSTALVIGLLALASLAGLVQMSRKRSMRVRAQSIRITRGLQIVVNRDCHKFQQ